jgi:hypothetical protein
MNHHDTQQNEEGLLLSGLDGANPLGFLAALGVLRLVQRCFQDRRVRMRWTQRQGKWLPLVTATQSVDEITNAMANFLGLGEYDESIHPFLGLGKNLSIDPKEFGHTARHLAGTACLTDRRSVDFISAFGCECVVHEKLPRITPTALHFIFGSGHQNYLETSKKLIREVTSEHLREAMMGPWLYRDEKLSFRWEPVDAREHAYQWTSPGDETTTTVWGANLLAFEGASLLSTTPQSNAIHTTGFSRHQRRNCFTWPIWQSPIDLATTQSVLTLAALQQEHPGTSELVRRGIQVVYRSVKIKLGEGQNFKWAFTPARRIA